MPPKRKRSSGPSSSVSTAGQPPPPGHLPDVITPPTEDALAAATAAVLALSEPIAGLSPSRSSPRRRTSARTAVKKRVTFKEDSDSEDKDAGSCESPLTEPEVKPEKKQKRARRKKDAEPTVYDIPDVERKQTLFTGRLGYACLNTILRVRKPEPVFCSRTCRLDTIRKNGIAFAKDLGLRNVADLMEVIEWNEANKIRFFRVSSEMFPFASHKAHGYTLAYARAELKAAGDLARRYGHRLTTHPGQFTQLASPKEDVVAASVRELEYHCEMMRYMELDQDSVIIIHMGGVYGDKEGTLARFRENYRTKLSDEMKARMVLENDEICYNPDDLLPVCEELNIPLVLDYHHNWIYPSVLPFAELLSRVAETWTRKGIRQKQHLSDPRPGAETVMEKRAHADRCKELPEVLIGGDVDLMIEAKDKEQAVFQLYRIYGLEPVLHENLRPEKPPKPFVRGKGRAAAQGDEDGEGDGEDVVVQVEGDVGVQDQGGVKEEGDATEDVASKPPVPLIPRVKRAPKRRRTATNVIASGPTPDEVGSGSWHLSEAKVASRGRPATSEQSPPRQRGGASKRKTHADILMNQEDVMVPVDGAAARGVEAEEHPEAVGAVM